MGNEYTPHYAGKTHQELYNQLMAGDPDQVAAVAADWHSAEGTARHIAGELDKDLRNLDWSGDSGTEFRYRLGLISGYSTDMANDHGNVKTSLTEMGSALRTARKKAQADHPEETDDNDSMWGGVAIGSATAGVPGAIVGGFLGHERDEEQKKAARQRMITLVSNLAANYGVTRSAINDPLPPPVDLPGGDLGNTSELARGPGAAAPRTGPGSHAAGTDLTSGTAPASGVSAGPATGTTGSDAGTSLLGTDGVVIGAGSLTAGAAVAGQFATLTASTAAGGLTAGTTALGATAALAGGMPIGGLLGQPSATGVNGARAPLDSTGRVASARPADPPGRAQGRDGVAARGNGGVANARNGPQNDDDEDGHDTWLTEDDMVWGNDDAAPPPVLGDPGPDANRPSSTADAEG